MRHMLAALAIAAMATGTAQAQSFSETFDGKTIGSLGSAGWTFTSSFTGVPFVSPGGDLVLLGTSTASFNFTVVDPTPVYVVSFFASRPTRFDNADLNVTLRQTAGGSFLQQQTFSPLPVTGLDGSDPAGAWVSQTFGQGLGAGTYRLTFANTGVLSTVTLDTLSITAVPEPGTFALMLAGLGVVAWAARRRPHRGEETDPQAA